MLHVLFLSASVAAGPAPVASPPRAARPSPAGHGKPSLRQTAAPALRSEDLFSLRARRRFAAYIRMRLLEMREAGLERAADAVERGLSVNELVPPLR